jgi:Fe-S cluster assembly ATP-binding protein
MKLEIKNLHARIEDKEILKGINLTLDSGEVTALMGPNGSGKSTLSNVIMGHPKYEVTEGEVLLDGENVLEMEVHERARAGIYLAFQYPTEVPGITVGKFLKRAVELRQEGDMSVTQYIKNLREKMNFMEMDQKFINRYLNEGFSGGEKKRMEVLQMLMLQPKFAILDETDSGLDIDALKVVSKGVNALRGESFGALIITHYQRILDYIKPDKVHILVDGKIVHSGNAALVNELEEKGYGWIREDMEVGV